MATAQMITETLRSRASDLRRLHVKSLEVFGSVARDEAGPESDVDMIVEFEPEARVGLIHFMRVKEYLSQALGGIEIDLATRDALHPALKNRILAEMRHVF